MSEYQYYEFLAIDRPLTQKQIGEVRQFSTRAEITSTHFVNEYHFGNFHGDPDLLISKYFDVMVYFANWGTRRLLIGIPEEMHDPAGWKHYESDHGMEMRKGKGRPLLELFSEAEGYDYDDFDEAGGSWMASLSPIRAEVLGGDLRPLFLGWLAGIAEDDEDDSDEPLPPIPPGLRQLTAAQEALSGFLRVDEDLLNAAAKLSPAELPPVIGLGAWIESLPSKENDQALLSLMSGDDPVASAKLMRRYQQESRAPSAVVPETSVTLASLRAAAAEIREEREAAERAARERQRVRREAEAARERENHIKQLMAGEAQAWHKVEEIVSTRQAKFYDDAVKTLLDLREVAVRKDALERFTARVRSLRDEHRGKYKFIQRLDKAALVPG